MGSACGCGEMAVDPALAAKNQQRRRTIPNWRLIQSQLPAGRSLKHRTQRADVFDEILSVTFDLDRDDDTNLSEGIVSLEQLLSVLPEILDMPDGYDPEEAIREAYRAVTTRKGGGLKTAMLNRKQPKKKRLPKKKPKKKKEAPAPVVTTGDNDDEKKEEDAAAAGEEEEAAAAAVHDVDDDDDDDDDNGDGAVGDDKKPSAEAVGEGDGGADAGAEEYGGSAAAAASSSPATHSPREGPESSPPPAGEDSQHPAAAAAATEPEPKDHEEEPEKEEPPVPVGPIEVTGLDEDMFWRFCCWINAYFGIWSVFSFNSDADQVRMTKDELVDFAEQTEMNRFAKWLTEEATQPCGTVEEIFDGALKFVPDGDRSTNDANYQLPKANDDDDGASSSVSVQNPLRAPPAAVLLRDASNEAGPRVSYREVGLFLMDSQFDRLVFEPSQLK